VLQIVALFRELVVAILRTVKAGKNGDCRFISGEKIAVSRKFTQGEADDCFFVVSTVWDQNKV
jgi:hypothetical protein